MRAQTGSSFPQRRAFAESGAANAVSLHDPTRENGIAERPQAFRYPEIKIIFPLNMPKAQRRAFQIVLPQYELSPRLTSSA